MESIVDEAVQLADKVELNRIGCDGFQHHDRGFGTLGPDEARETVGSESLEVKSERKPAVLGLRKVRPVEIRAADDCRNQIARRGEMRHFIARDPEYSSFPLPDKFKLRL